MEILLNNKNEIINYAIVGHVDGFTEYTGEIPEDFADKFKPSLYLMKENIIIENPDYVVPDITVPNGPTNSDKTVAALTLQMAKQSERQDKFNAQLLLKIAQLGGEANV